MSWEYLQASPLVHSPLLWKMHSTLAFSSSVRVSGLRALDLGLLFLPSVSWEAAGMPGMGVPSSPGGGMLGIGAVGITKVPSAHAAGIAGISGAALAVLLAWA